VNVLDSLIARITITVATFPILAHHHRSDEENGCSKERDGEFHDCFVALQIVWIDGPFNFNAMALL
jgi:hypothetical protein